MKPHSVLSTSVTSVVLVKQFLACPTRICVSHLKASCKSRALFPSETAAPFLPFLSAQGWNTDPQNDNRSCSVAPKIISTSQIELLRKSRSLFKILFPSGAREKECFLLSKIVDVRKHERKNVAQRRVAVQAPQSACAFSNSSEANVLPPLPPFVLLFSYHSTHLL